MTVLSILNEIAADASGNAKKAILQREKNNTALKAVIEATYNPYINYWLKKIPDYTAAGSADILWGLDQLKALTSRQVTGHAAIAHLVSALNKMNADDATVLCRVIDRDLRAGFSDSTANKIWPGLIPTFEVLLCHKDTTFITYPAFAQEKGDGLRCHLMFDGQTCRAFSRAGKEIETRGHFDETAKVMMNPGEVWDGELLFYRNNVCLSRKEGNGIANKAIKGTISDDEIKMMRLMTWGIVDFTSTISYIDILAEMNTRFIRPTTFVKMLVACPTEVVNSEEEAQKFYLKMRAAGKEGAVIKNFDLKWEGKRVKGAGKCKAVEEREMLVIAQIEGTGKYTGMLGAIVCTDKSKKIVVNVGSGFSDSERSEYWHSSLVGKIVTVAYNEVISDKSNNQYSLFLPRLTEVRIDKTEPDDFSVF